MTRIIAGRALTDSGWRHNVLIDIAADGTIASVSPDQADAPADAQRVRVLVPAMPNLHSHAFQRAMAGMTEYRSASRDSFWTWRELMYRFLDHLTPDHIEAIAAQAFMEMLEAGYGAVGEFHYVHHQPGGAPYDERAELSNRTISAAKQTGIGLTHLPVLYTFGGAGEAPLTGGQRRFGNDPERFARLVDDIRKRVAQELANDARVGVAPHSLRATSPAHLAEAARQYNDVPFHIHISEQLREVDEIGTWLGDRPIAWLIDNIDVSENWCLIHATHMTDNETNRFAASRAVAGLCPITEANLGDGIFNGTGFLSQAGRFGIGTDSNIHISLSGELRQLEYSQRLRDRARNVLLMDEGSLGDALYLAAAAGGAQALGRPCGAIREGLLADLVAVDDEDDRLFGLADKHLLSGWIFAADDRVVRDVWSAGRHVVQDGRHIARGAVSARYRSVLSELTATL